MVRSVAVLLLSGGVVAAVGAATVAAGSVPVVIESPSTPTTPDTTNPPKPTDPPTAPPTPADAGTFDAADFFGDAFFRLSIEPGDLLAGDIEQTLAGSPAELFVFYLFSFGVAHRDNTTAPLPLFTVTPDGEELTVCDEFGDCQVYGKFATSGGRLRSFSIDGLSIDDRLGGYFRATTVEALTIDAAVVFQRPGDDVLSIVVLFGSEDGATEFMWDEAYFIDQNGTQFSPDLSASVFTDRVESGGLGSAMLDFPDARPDGQLVIPITTDQTGEPTTIRIPVRLSGF